RTPPPITPPILVPIYHHHSSPPHFFFTAPATTEIYTLSLHDALPIYRGQRARERAGGARGGTAPSGAGAHRPRLGHGRADSVARSEEHTSELQSPCNLVCRLLLEKKKKKKI